MTTEKQTHKKWTEDRVEQLLQIVGSDSEPVTAEAVVAAARMLEVSERSIASKLRNLGREVASLAKEKAPTFTEQETEDLAGFLDSNAGQFTFKEIAAEFAGGKFTAKQIQGKVLALDMSDCVKPTEQVQVEKKYTEAEEAEIIDMATSGASLEDISAALGKPVNSIRGKALSLLSAGKIAKIPHQAEHTAKDDSDPIEELGEGIAEMTVEEIAATTGKTARGIKTILTRRGIKVKDYNGESKREKAEKKRQAA